MTTNPNEHLFTLRLWRKEDADGCIQWRGKLHHINNNDVRYFQDWPALIPLLLAMLRAFQSQPLRVEEDTVSQDQNRESNES